MSSAEFGDLIDRALRASPHSTAIQHGDATVSYAALRSVVVRTAELIDRSVQGPGPIVLIAERSVSAYACYLAIILAHRTVVPLDPNAPEGQLRAVCISVGASAILHPNPGSSMEYRIEPVEVENAEPSDALYILHTSGSTGAPKGVPIGAKQAMSYLNFALNRWGSAPAAKHSANYGLAFDLSFHDVFVALSSGACLVVPTAREAATPVRFIRRTGITHWFSVPSAAGLASRTRTLSQGALPSLIQSLFCGEQLQVSVAAAWAEAGVQSTIENLYGPTELTVACASYLLPRSRQDWPRTTNGTVPIGQVFPHLDYEVRDAGELVVRGPQRMDGYINPSHNLGSFDPEVQPIGSPPNPSSYYRTGDRVTDDGHGCLVHIGRVDRQVKVRGFRIELGSIEHVLRELDGVHEAAVIVVGTGEVSRLTAAVFGDVDRDALARHVRARLVRHERPSAIEILANWPLSTNGKTDYGAIREILAPIECE